MLLGTRVDLYNGVLFYKDGMAGASQVNGSQAKSINPRHLNGGHQPCMVQHGGPLSIKLTPARCWVLPCLSHSLLGDEQVRSIKAPSGENHALNLGQHAVEERVVAARGGSESRELGIDSVHDVDVHGTHAGFVMSCHKYSRIGLPGGNVPAPAILCEITSSREYHP